MPATDFLERPDILHARYGIYRSLVYSSYALRSFSSAGTFLVRAREFLQVMDIFRAHQGICRTQGNLLSVFGIPGSMLDVQLSDRKFLPS